LREYDAPIRKREIEKATKKHEAELIEKELIAKGCILFFFKIASHFRNLNLIQFFTESLVYLAQQAGVKVKSS
jgi:hypothetical protein